MEMLKSIHLKAFILIIMVTFLVKCIYFYGDFSNKYTTTGYLDPKYWLPTFKVKNKLSSTKILSFNQPHLKYIKEKNRCRSMFEIPKSTEQNWDKDEPFEALSKSLPPLLIWPKEHEENYGASHKNISLSEVNESWIGTAKEPILLDETRLQILNGSVPYLPCKIKYYTADDVESCVLTRAAVGSTTWIAFVGASKMREKLHEFLTLLPKSFIYEYFLAEEQVSLEKFLDSITDKVHGDYDVIGYTNDTFNKDKTHKIKITVVWEPFGTGIEYNETPPKNPSTRLFKWATDISIPDVIVIGLGTWYLVQPASKHNENQLNPYDLLDFNIRKLKDTLQQITKKTKVLLWAQGRYRQYHFLSEPRPPGDFKESQVNLWFQSRLYLHTLSYSIGYMDSWLSNIILKDSQIWRWDSTLPFHYANIDECSSWRPSAIINYPNGSLQSDSRYKGTWWHCDDTHHSSYQTNHDEAIMLLNLICNPYKANINMPEDLCC